MAKKTKFTIYDVMDNNGVFELNPANTCSPEYKGPHPYPKMLYHPEGEMKIVQPAEFIATPFGPRAVNEHSEMIYKVVNNEEEELKLLKAGWHATPAEALEAGGGPAAPKDPETRIAQLEAQRARDNAELEELRAFKLAAATKRQQGNVVIGPKASEGAPSGAAS